MTAPLNAVILQRKFIIRAPQTRVWEVLGSAIYRDLPLEKMDIVNENLFYADMIWRAGLPLKFRVKAEFREIVPPDALNCGISTVQGPLKISFGVSFKLRGLTGHQTEVSCKVVREKGINPLLNTIISGQMRRFAVRIVTGIEAQLERLSEAPAATRGR